MCHKAMYAMACLSEALGSGLAGLSHALVAAAGETSFHRQRSRVYSFARIMLCAHVSPSFKDHASAWQTLPVPLRSQNIWMRSEKPSLSASQHSQTSSSYICLVPTVFDDVSSTSRCQTCR